MKKAIEKTVILILIAFSVGSWYLGAYLPFQKAKKFIEVIRSDSVVRTIDELERRFDSALDFYSPVGEDEVISFFADQMVSVLSTKPAEDIGGRLIAYAEEKARPVLEDSRQFGTDQGSPENANLNELGWIVYRKEEYFRKAEAYIFRGLELSPNRPQFLYGLFNLYASINDKERTRAVGEKILSFWPNDEVMRARLSALLAS